MPDYESVLRTLPHNMTRDFKEEIPSLEDAVAYINKLDFSLLKGKLTVADPTVSRIWSSEEFDCAAEYYKNFLFLNKKYLDKVPIIVPSIEVDEIWHHHILDTRRYFVDSSKIFGYYFHHFPYFGMRGSSDKSNLIECFEMTQRIYELEFGERMVSIWS